jgi:small nuclear ribonucleoprotein (snRNP)-like protein
VNLRDGRTASGRLDAFDDSRVLIFDKTDKAAYYDRNKVLSIAITTDASGRFSPGQEGIVLKNGTVLKGRVKPMDFSNRDMPNVVVQTGRKLESTPCPMWLSFNLKSLSRNRNTRRSYACCLAYQQWIDTGVSEKVDRMFFRVFRYYLTCGPRSIDECGWSQPILV